MIFVTVGTHEQPFDRLLKSIDALIESGVITEQVIIQTGYSTYHPLHAECQQFIPYDQMWEYVKKARIVITHGGPSSFIMPLQVGKIPVVVPRQEKFKEHVNNHQLDFCNEVSRRNHDLILVDDIEELGSKIKNYNQIVSSISDNHKSNNAAFIRHFSKIIADLLS